MQNDPDVTDAVIRAINGDAAAFETVIRVHARAVYSQIYVILQNKQDTEDVSQDTFLKAFTYLNRLDDPARIRPWLLAIARNLARDFIRRRSRASFCELMRADELPDPAGPPGEELEAQEWRRDLGAAVAGLPEAHRTALSMRYYDELDHRAIESNMGVSNGRLSGLLGRGLQRLRQRFGDRRP